MAVPMWQIVKEAVAALNGHATYEQITSWIKSKYGDVNEKIIGTQTISCTVNQPSRVYFLQNSNPRDADENHDFLYSVGRRKVAFYEPNVHVSWGIEVEEAFAC